MVASNQSRVSAERGSLRDRPVSSILDTCEKTGVSGTLRVMAHGAEGLVEIKRGKIVGAWFAGSVGEDAVRLLRALTDGEYVITARQKRMARGSVAPPLTEIDGVDRSVDLAAGRQNLVRKNSSFGLPAAEAAPAPSRAGASQALTVGASLLLGGGVIVAAVAILAYLGVF